MNIKKVKAAGIKFAYRWDGNRNGPVVMMAHAMGTSHRIWDWQVPALEDHYRLLRYDWRGHGDTNAPPGPYTLTQFVSDATAVMDALNLDKVHWVGISTGGMIGQGLGIYAPERIASLSLCNTTSRSTDWYREWVKERQAVVKEGGMSPVWDMTDKLWFTDAFVEAANTEYQAIRDVFVKTPVPGYLAGTSAVADLAYLPDLPKIKAPTRIIAAGDDPVTPIVRAEEIRDGIPGSELTVIDGQRHFSNVEVPDAFNAVLRKGLDEMLSKTEQ